MNRWNLRNYLTCTKKLRYAQGKCFTSEKSMKIAEKTLT